MHTSINKYQLLFNIEINIYSSCALGKRKNKNNNIDDKMMLQRLDCATDLLTLRHLRLKLTDTNFCMFVCMCVHM